MARRCCLCGAYLDSGERCDCGCSQTDEVPSKWLKVSPPKRVNMTEEQRKAAADRMRSMIGRK